MHLPSEIHFEEFSKQNEDPCHGVMQRPQNSTEFEDKTDLVSYFTLEPRKMMIKVG